jgi:hypothetical protein
MIGAAVLSALINSGPAWRRGLALVVLLCGLATQRLPETTLERSLLGLCGLVPLIRGIDLFRMRRSLPPRARIWHQLSAVDSRQLRRAPRRFDARATFASLGWTALGFAGLAVAWWAPALPVRWLGGAAVAYAFVSLLWSSATAIYSAVGFTTPPLHRMPIAALSLQEMWGERWARPVALWLRATLFRPNAARGRPLLGHALAFGVSAVGHAGVVAVCLGPLSATWMLLFFLVQGALVLVEQRTRVKRWPRFAAHAWVLGAMLLASPLFVEPLLHCIGVPAGRAGYLLPADDFSPSSPK